MLSDAAVLLGSAGTIKEGEIRGEGAFKSALWLHPRRVTADDVRKTSAGSPAEVVTSLLSPEAECARPMRHFLSVIGAMPGTSAKPRVPVPNHVSQFVAHFAGRDRTLWWLKSHIGILHLLPGCTPESTKGPPPLNDIRQAGAKRKNRTYRSRRWRVTSRILDLVAPSIQSLAVRCGPLGSRWSARRDAVCACKAKRQAAYLDALRPLRLYILQRYLHRGYRYLLARSTSLILGDSHPMPLRVPSGPREYVSVLGRRPQWPR